MNVSFRISRYLVALLWHWTLPFMFGAVAASVSLLLVVQESFNQLDKSLETAIGRVADSCTAAELKPTFIPDHSERSDSSADLVSQHWREAASPWVARRAQGVTLTKRSTNVQSEGASKCAGTSSVLVRGSPERARGNPYQAQHECAEAKVHLILKESLAKPGNKVIDLGGRDGQERKGLLPVGPRQIVSSFGLVAQQ